MATGPGAARRGGRAAQSTARPGGHDARGEQRPCKRDSAPRFFQKRRNQDEIATKSGPGAAACGDAAPVPDRLRERQPGGDLFSIRTSVVYPADSGELIDYAAQEQEENARPELTTHIENLDGYDTIFIGYPNW